MPVVKERSVDELLKGPLLRKHQQEAWRKEIEHTDRLLAREEASSLKSLTNPARIRLQNERRKRLLAEQSPRPLSGEEKDQVSTLSKRLLADIKEGMVSKAEQRRNPAQEIGLRHRIDQWHRAKKDNVVRWKHAQILLNPDSTDPDLCNIEKYRPEGPLEAMLNAQIPGYMGFDTPHMKERWEEIFHADWRDQETQEQFIKRMAEMGITVNFAKASGMRPKATVIDQRDGEDATVMTVMPPGAPKKKGGWPKGRTRKVVTG